MTNFNHYGKDLTELTEEEQKLLKIDLMIFVCHREIMDSTDEIKKQLIKDVCSLFIDERLVLCSKLLNVDKDDEETIFFVEETRFSYRQFLIDKDSNDKKHKEESKFKFEFSLN